MSNCLMYNCLRSLEWNLIIKNDNWASTEKKNSNIKSKISIFRIRYSTLKILKNYEL